MAEKKDDRQKVMMMEGFLSGSSNRRLILGVPISNMTMQEMTQAITAMIAQYQVDRLPRYISTVNINFLVQAHSCCWNGTVRHPELLHVLRESALATADGMPLIWLSRLLRQPINERITGVDLLLEIAHTCSSEKLSLYLLGGEEEVTKKAAENLEKYYSGLKIAGYATPLLEVAGDDLAEANERDLLFLEQIHAVKPDLLLLNLGNPKQELWFERIYHQLRVPVTIGVGGTFSFLARTVKRAPLWMQHSGLEWCYRLYQEPRRLWRRYTVDLIKFGALALPLLLYHTWSRWCWRWRGSKKSLRYRRHNLLFLSSNKTVAVLFLPTRINNDAHPLLACQYEEAFDHDAIILNFEAVTTIDLSGMALLLTLCLEARQKKKELYLLAPSPHIQRLFKVHRLWDLLAASICRRPYDIVSKFLGDSNHSPLYEAVYQEDHQVTLAFLGQLDHHQDYGKYLKAFAPLFHQKDCLLDLTYCTYIDNAGLIFLMQLQKQRHKEQCHLKVCGVSKELHRTFKLAKVDTLFDLQR